jgi:hypothetical protein
VRWALLFAAGSGGVEELGGNADGGAGTELTSLGTAERLVSDGSARGLIDGGGELLGASARLISPTSSE